MRSSLKFYILIGFFALLFMVSRANGQFMFLQNPLSGKPAPDFKLNTLKGDELSFSEFRGKQNAIIFFWATWCPHCRNALANLNKTLPEMESKNIKIAAVDIGEDRQDVMSFLNRLKVGDLDVFLDVDGEVSEKYMIVGVPSFIFVGKDGIVKTVKHEIPENLDKIFWE